jgi:hypothetical protein
VTKILANRFYLVIHKIISDTVKRELIPVAIVSMFGERKNLTGESLPVGKAMEQTKSSVVQREYVICVYVLSIEHRTVPFCMGKGDACHAATPIACLERERT